MRIKFRLMAILLGVFILGFAVTAAADVLDQFPTTEYWSIVWLDSYDGLAQVYTAGLNGTLSRVGILSLSSLSSGSVEVSIRGVDGGVPNSEILGSTTIDKFYNSYITFSNAIDQIAGEQYAIVMIPSSDFQWGPMTFSWNTNYDAYPEGSMCMLTADTWSSTSADLGFSTFVNVNPVPEPSAFLLLGSGLLGLVAYGRNRFYKK